SLKVHYFKYFLALFFGLIHGLGFSNYLKSLLGKESSIIGPLFSFNLGIEIGQFLIVAIIIFFTWILVDLLGVKRREWNLILSGAGLGISLTIIIDRLPLL
ncbi:MAG: HupE/UreJ family protein, partial [Bacteroidota bacterium]|nr:HupE/UreJ family protein [Bacteroidota bacterium]